MDVDFVVVVVLVVVMVVVGVGAAVVSSCGVGFLGAVGRKSGFRFLFRDPYVVIIFFGPNMMSVKFKD